MSMSIDEPMSNCYICGAELVYKPNITANSLVCSRFPVSHFPLGIHWVLFGDRYKLEGDK